MIGRHFGTVAGRNERFESHIRNQRQVLKKVVLLADEDILSFGRHTLLWKEISYVKYKLLITFLMMRGRVLLITLAGNFSCAAYRGKIVLKILYEWKAN